MAQTSYSVNTTAGIVGQLADTSDKVIRSFSAEVAIAVGRGVMKGTADNQVKLPTATGQKFYGVALLKANQEQDASGVVQYAAEDVVDVLTRGVVWVTVEQNVAPGDPVYIRFTTNGGNTPGGFRKDADTDKADAVSGARFLTTATAGNLAQLELNLPA